MTSENGASENGATSETAASPRALSATSTATLDSVRELLGERARASAGDWSLPFRRAAPQHVGLIATVALFALMVMKVWAISRLDPTTATVLYIASGPAPIAVNVLDVTLPMILVAIGLEFYISAITRFRRRSRIWWVGFLLTLLITVALLRITYLLSLAVLVLLFTALLSILRGRGYDLRAPDIGQAPDIAPLERVLGELDTLEKKVAAQIEEHGDQPAGQAAEPVDVALVEALVEDMRRRSHKWFEDFTPYLYYLDWERRRFDWRIYALVYGIGIGLVVLVSPFWQPPELLELDSGESAVAYVLAEGDWFTILHESDRRVERIPSDAVAGRSLCSLGESRWWELSLPLFLLEHERPVYPPCDTLSQAAR